MDAPRLVLKFYEGLDGPVQLLRNGRPVVNGTWEDCTRALRPQGLTPGSEYLIVSSRATTRMRFLTPEERAAGASPVVAIKPRRKQQPNEATA